MREQLRTLMTGRGTDIGTGSEVLSEPVRRARALVVQEALESEQRGHLDTAEDRVRWSGRRCVGRKHRTASVLLARPLGDGSEGPRAPTSLPPDALLIRGRSLTR